MKLLQKAQSSRMALAAVVLALAGAACGPAQALGFKAVKPGEEQKKQEGDKQAKPISKMRTAAAPLPRVTDIEPEVVGTDGGSLVTLTGRNFVHGMIVYVGGASVPVTTVSATQARFVSPPGVGTSAMRLRAGQSTTSVGELTFTKIGLSFTKN